MKKILARALLAATCFATATPATHAATNVATNVATKAGVVAFNHALATATRAMDNPAMLALWDSDGTSLLPDSPAIRGKPAIARFLEKVGKQLQGAHMQKFDLACHDIQASGDWASEWCDEHQQISFANGHPPFDGQGRMLFVLHRGPDRTWRLKLEMWQPSNTPQPP